MNNQTIPVIILRGGASWCKSMYIKMFKNKLDNIDTGYNFSINIIESGQEWPVSEGAVVLIHGHFWSGHYDKYKWVIAMRTDDEEDEFDIFKIKHSNIKWWVQYPVMGRDYGDARLIPIGTPNYFDDLPSARPVKDIDIFLSAQDTHQRRHDVFETVDRIKTSSSFVNRTDGFSAGISREDYRNKALRSKIMPAPSGAVSPDSFRLYEALESHAYPIADDISPQIESKGFFKRLFPDAPFPIIEDWGELEHIVLNYQPDKQKEIDEWWTNYKKSLIMNLRKDIEKLCKI